MSTTTTTEDSQFTFLHFDGKLWPFDPKRVSYMDPFKVTHGHVALAKPYKLLVGDKTIDVPIVLQAPKCVSPFGIGESDSKFKDGASGGDDSKGGSRLSIALTLGQSTPRQKQWMKMLKQWDEIIPSVIITNRSKWLANADVSDEAVRIFYSPIVRKGKRKVDGTEYAPRFNLRIDPSTCTIQDRSDKPASWSDVVPQSQVIPAMTYTGIFFGERIISNRFKADLVKFIAPIPTISKIVVTEEEEEL